MNISKKLFLSLVGLTALVLILTLSLARLGFAQGFSDFINALEKQRLENVALDLASVYERYNNDWQQIPPFELDKVMQLHELGNKKPPPHKRQGPDRADGPRQRPPAPTTRPLPSIINTVLLDLQGEPLLDRPVDLQAWAQNATQTEVTIELNAQPIGILRSYHTNLMDSNIASAFSRQQLIWSAGVGGLCLLLATLLAYLLSQVLLNPIQIVLKSVARLRAGEYDLSLSHTKQDEFGQLMTDIESLSQTLNSTKLAKSKWIADISHELRTPLTVLIGEIDLLKAGIRPFNQANLASLADEVNRLNRLVEDLYQLSVSGTGALRYQMHSLVFLPVLTGVLAKKQREFSNKNILVELQNQLPGCEDSQLKLYADEQRIEQLLLNLLNNSLQYTDPNGKLLVQLSQDSDELVVTFADTAPSVNQHECEQLFDPLHRQDAARTRHTSGAGLGLAICRNIVKAHDGQIHAMPSELGGIAIKIRLPIRGEK